MRTRSRQGSGSGQPEVEETTASLPTRSPRSSKKRKATKKSKALAAASTTTPPPSTSSKQGVGVKGARLEGPEGSARSAARKGVEAAEGKEGQSLGKGKGTDKASDKLAAAAAPSVGVAPKGRCVSGRDWKARNQSQRASMQRTTATETLSSTWAKKLEIKAKRQAIMAMEKEMRDAKLKEIEDKKQEKLEREKRRQQNEMKNTTYQTISKTHKMKTMSKKQLRQIKKRQVNSRTGEIEFVSPWGGGKKKQ
ncbi:unnamed protein product [Scytosiphon promiscuus]